MDWFGLVHFARGRRLWGIRVMCAACSRILFFVSFSSSVSLALLVLGFSWDLSLSPVGGFSLF